MARPQPRTTHIGSISSRPRSQPKRSSSWPHEAGADLGQEVPHLPPGRSGSDVRAHGYRVPDPRRPARGQSCALRRRMAAMPN
eukprot:3253197-Pyramimonas_sp.AAC.1